MRDSSICFPRLACQLAEELVSSKAAGLRELIVGSDNLGKVWLPEGFLCKAARSKSLRSGYL